MYLGKIPNLYLYLRQDRDNRDDDAKDEVEADENFVVCAVIWLCVINVEQHHGCESQCIVKYSERQQP